MCRAGQPVTLCWRLERCMHGSAASQAHLVQYEVLFKVGFMLRCPRCCFRGKVIQQHIPLLPGPTAVQPPAECRLSKSNSFNLTLSFLPAHTLWL